MIRADGSSDRTLHDLFETLCRDSTITLVCRSTDLRKI